MITTGDWQNALEPITRKNFFLGVKEVPAELEMLYNVTNSSKLTETYMEMGDTGSTGDFTGSLDYDDVDQGNTMTITAVEKAKGMKIQKKFVSTDQLSIAKDLPEMLGLSARRRIAGDVFAPFNNAFNTSLTTIDGLQLCSAAHTSSHAEGSSQSNRGTTAYSAVALEAARISMTNFLTNRDNKFDVNPSLIICGESLAESVWETLNSTGKMDTTNNNRNFHSNGRWSMLVSRWLDDTNNWFVVDMDLMKKFLVWNVVDPLDFQKAEDFDGLTAKFRSYMFYGFGSRQWQWIYGQEV